MNVSIAYAPQDLAQAEALAAALRQRGFLAALETGEGALLPLAPNDAVIGIISKDFVFSPYRLRLEKRLLDAWADGQLVLVKLDHALAPVGLRDLPAIDGSFEAKRDFTWFEVADALRAMQTQPPQASPAPAARAPDVGDEYSRVSVGSRLERARPPRSSIEYDYAETAAPEVPPVASGSGAALKRAAPKKSGVWLVLLALLAAGGGAAYYFLIGPGAGAPPSAIVHGDQPANPMPPPDYVPPVEVAGVSFSQPILMATAIVVGLIILGFVAVGAARKAALERKMGKPDRKAPRTTSATAEAAKEEVPPAVAPPPKPAHAEPLVFISYARADQPRVDPLARAVKDSGHPIWIDTDEINAGTSWAGEIVRAIKAAGHVLIMCSPRSFESDQVKREVYLADRYKKPLMPVFLEAADPPEDFEYFFAGVQWLKLHEAPEAERPAILARALPAA
jgi:hypothetical protein